ncbi:MAG: S26 family signal peptidase [Candidatus Micrarchaeota archaeon]
MKTGKKDLLPWALGAVLVVSLALYVFTKFFLLGVVALASFLALVFIDVAPSKWDRQSVRTAAKEVGVAVAAAVAIWVGLIVFLQTPSPIDAVTSCSMVPVLDRGDLILVQGGEVKAPKIRFSGSFPEVGVRKTPCVKEVGGQSLQWQCTSAVIAGGQSFGFNSSNDVVVFDTPTHGLVVHRAWLAFENESGVFLVTKGDNNDGLDQESDIGFVEKSRLHGKVVARLPYVGLLKLFLFGQFDEPPGCNVRIR